MTKTRFQSLPWKLGRNTTEKAAAQNYDGKNYSLHKFYCLISLLLVVFGLAFKLFSAAY